MKTLILLIAFAIFLSGCITLPTSPPPLVCDSNVIDAGEVIRQTSLDYLKRYDLNVSILESPDFNYSGESQLGYIYFGPNPPVAANYYFGSRRFDTCEVGLSFYNCLYSAEECVATKYQLTRYKELQCQNGYFNEADEELEKYFSCVCQNTGIQPRKVSFEVNNCDKCFDAETREQLCTSCYLKDQMTNESMSCSSSTLDPIPKCNTTEKFGVGNCILDLSADLIESKQKLAVKIITPKEIPELTIKSGFCTFTAKNLHQGTNEITTNCETILADSSCVELYYKDILIKEIGCPTYA
jgi:hypothetical protein